MPPPIETLLVRNLRDVFGERDAIRRETAIRALFAPDCLFTDPRGQHHGHTGLADAVAALQAQFPDYVFAQIGAVDILQDSGRMPWSFGPPGDPRRITGLDVITLRAGQIASLYTFVDRIAG